MVIWKFPIDVQDEQEISAPTGTEFLTVQVQNGTPCIWALCDPSQPTISYRVYVRGTGRTFEKHADADYLGTIQMMGGSLIWHVFV